MGRQGVIESKVRAAYNKFISTEDRKQFAIDMASIGDNDRYAWHWEYVLKAIDKVEKEIADEVYSFTT